jgi:hypothetical protein
MTKVVEASRGPDCHAAHEALSSRGYRSGSLRRRAVRFD